RPHPSSPTRTAELASVPRTRREFKIVNTPAAPAVFRNVRRSVSILIGSPNQLFEIGLGGQNVGGLFVSADLPFDSQRIAVPDLLEPGDEGRKVHLAFADGNFAAELFRIGGIK